MPDINFKDIVDRGGSKSTAFEQLCCQLARRNQNDNGSFYDLNGAGGDGGLECWYDDQSQNRTGWQAKYVFDVDSLLKQTKESLATALAVHPNLKCYIICFPFDLTGPLKQQPKAKRRRKSGIEKYEDWKQKRLNEVHAMGRELEIIIWPKSSLIEKLITLDISGGIREFFFNKNVLSLEWFARHLEDVKIKAGPRYSPKINVETRLAKLFDALGRTENYKAILTEKVTKCQNKVDDLSVIKLPKENNEHIPDISTNQEMLKTALANCLHLLQSFSLKEHQGALAKITSAFDELKKVGVVLENDLNKKYGEDVADSVGFRQFQAEYMVSFPASELDKVRETIREILSFINWLSIAEGRLAFERTLLLTGDAGSGKTHGICDIAEKRLEANHLTCIVYGHEFKNEPDLWTRINQTLGLRTSLGRDGLLDALEFAATLSKDNLLICIDAINESRSPEYWNRNLAAFVTAITKRPNLQVCLTCRTGFTRLYLPQPVPYYEVKHEGFRGIEREACTSFFAYYGLKPPIEPILRPEMGNPLFLKLLCETLKSRGYEQLPPGWYGHSFVIREFLEEKERSFAIEKACRPASKIATRSLQAICQAIVNSQETSLPWSQAQQIIEKQCPHGSRLNVIEWLIEANLLFEDAPLHETTIPNETTLRPGFERFGDHLVASTLLENMHHPRNLQDAFSENNPLHFLVKDINAMHSFRGILSELAILIPEKVSGLELPDCIDNISLRKNIIEIAIESFPWRSPESFTTSSRKILIDAIKGNVSSGSVLDTILSISWFPSKVDAIWVFSFLNSIPLTQRDAVWAWYLHVRYEQSGAPKKLIDAAFELPLDNISVEVVERWALILLWFTAASDRRVKDYASRAAIAILTAYPQVIPPLVRRFLAVDDDEIKERVLLCTYGALMLSRDKDAVQKTTSLIQKAYKTNANQFDNAIIRDNIRCITELAVVLNVLPEGCYSHLSMGKIDGGQWPLELPSERDMENWKKLPRLHRSCINDDFNHYSLNCLRNWAHNLGKEDQGKWILKSVANDMGYANSNCKKFDKHLVQTYGPGRGKPSWAERIGKKYQWIALYKLASRLFDNVDKRNDYMAPDALLPPLILAEERKFDPTLPVSISEEDTVRSKWWKKNRIEFEMNTHLSHEDWMVWENDLPSMSDLIDFSDDDKNRWKILKTHSTWSEAHKNGSIYRHAWITLSSYLISCDKLQYVLNRLQNRNFFGRWLPEGASWLYGFAGEYPWGTAFNTEPDAWHGFDDTCSDLSTIFLPSWNELAVEYEYDATLANSGHIHLPSKLFFLQGDLWWDGQNGFRNNNGKLIFSDPGCSNKDPEMLLADKEELLQRLNQLGLTLIWTLNGEKWVINESNDKRTPPCTFSQLAYLNQDGSIDFSDRSFFRNYDENIGPLPIIKDSDKSLEK